MFMSRVPSVFECPYYIFSNSISNSNIKEISILPSIWEYRKYQWINCMWSDKLNIFTIRNTFIFLPLKKTIIYLIIYISKCSVKFLTQVTKDFRLFLVEILGIKELGSPGQKRMIPSEWLVSSLPSTELWRYCYCSPPMTSPTFLTKCSTSFTFSTSLPYN